MERESGQREGDVGYDVSQAKSTELSFSAHLAIDRNSSGILLDFHLGLQWRCPKCCDIRSNLVGLSLTDDIVLLVIWLIDPAAVPRLSEIVLMALILGTSSVHNKELAG
jgi:hypothetical protein